jgi:polysaccharide biosynthesis/export protein
MVNHGWPTLPVDSAGGRPHQKMRLRLFAFLTLAAAILAGCADTPTPTAPVVQPTLVSAYTLDSGDVLRVIVFGQPDLTNTYEIDQAGAISVPLIGGVPARGKTTGILASEITARLRQSVLRDPNVAVEIAQYRPVFITGEVAAGGQYAYVAGLTVQEAIAMAGGFTPRANRRTVAVTRSADGHIFALRLDLTDPVFPGDTLTISQRLF